MKALLPALPRTTRPTPVPRPWHHSLPFGEALVIIAFGCFLALA